MSRSAIKAGEGFVELKLKNRIAEGASRVQGDLDKLSKRAMAIGATIAASSASMLALPLREASRMEETMGKFEVVFGDSAKDVQKWSEITAAAVGVSRQAMADMLSSMQDLLVPMGVLPDEATGMSKTLSALAVDLASFNNMNTAEVFANLMSAITGEGQVMKKYGVILTETATKQELLNMKLDPKTADNAAKAQARLNIILRGTTAAQGDAIRTAGSFENQMKALWASVVDTTGAIGGAFLDDMSALVAVSKDAVSVVSDFVDDNRDLVRVAGLAAVALGGLGAGIVGVGIAAKATAVTIGMVGAASQAAATAASLAWAGVSAAFFVLTLKSRITAAVVTAGWKVAAKAVSVAWTVATSLIGVAMQGLTAVVSAVAVASPWIAGAAAIATAFFGLDVVLATLAAGASAAWAAAAGVVGTAWAAVSGVLAATGIAGAASAFMASSAWSAFGVLGSILAAKSTIEAKIVGLAWAGAGMATSASWAVVNAVLTSTTFWAGALAVAGGAVGASLGAAAGVASAAWTIAWAAMAGPLAPFIVGAGYLAAVLATIGAVAGIAAVKAIDFGAAWGKAKDILSGIVKTITQVANVIQVALTGGNYGAAAEALWLGIQLAFWRGVAGSIDAVKWLWGQAMTTTVQFSVELLKIVNSLMDAIVLAITDPFSASETINNALAQFAAAAVTFNVDANTEEAEKNLAELYAKLKMNQAAGGPGGGPGGGGAGGQGGGQGDDKTAEKFRDKARALQLEIVELQRGEKAADRMRLADEGLNATQIRQIELLKEKKKALEDVQAAQAKAEAKAQADRMQEISKRADRLREDGAAPGDVFRKTMDQINADQRGGKLNQENAGQAREAAKAELDAGMQRLRAEGRALAEAIRTPAQILSDRITRIGQLQGAGVITQQQADKAIQMEKQDFAEEQKAREERAEKKEKAIIEEQRRVGPSGSFSAFGAALISGGEPRFEQQQLKASREIVKNTKEIARQAGKPRRGVFG